MPVSLLDSLIQFAGRLHPMVLHAPIGLALGLLAVEALAILRGKVLPRDVRSSLAWLAALSAVVTAASGLLLSREGGHDAETVWLHQWLGIGVAAACLTAAVLQQLGRTGLYGVMLAVTTALLVPAGHLGASMTHGPDFLTEPFAPPRAAAPWTPPAPTSVEAGAAASAGFGRVAQILQNRCTACHGAERHKGGLRLDTPEAIRLGGEDGAIVVPSDVGASELVRRLRLPPDDDDHMPPRSKPQPSEEEIKAIEEWIASGASFETSGPVEAAPAASESVSAPAGPPPADPAVIADIRRRLVHVEPIARGDTLLLMDASAVARSVNDDAAAELLAPVKEQVADLTLARTNITDRTMALLASMPHLRRLNIGSTGVTDAGLAALKGDASLTELVLTRTKITDAASETLASMSALKKVYVWGSGMTAEGVAALREKLKGVTIDAGDAPDSSALDAEHEVKLSSEEPLPGQAPAAAPTDALKPVNAMCPVSGKPIDPEYAIVYKGKVIGFCCRHCVAQFFEDPAKFADKIK